MTGTKHLIALSFAICLAVVPALAQDPVAQNLRSLLDGYRQNIQEAAQKTADGDFDFKPSPDVRTFRQQLGHIADANYSMCSQIKEETNPNASSVEKQELTKPEIMKTVDTSFTYCLSVLEGMDGAALAKTVKRGNTERAKAWTALHLLEHTGLHYGNLIVYMRLKGVVPPETERRQRSR